MVMGTIFGRSPNLALGVLTALFNVIILFHVGGFNPTAEQISSVNILFGSMIAFVANIPQTTIAAGIHAIRRLNDAAPAGKMPGTDIANQSVNGDHDIKVINT